MTCFNISGDAALNEAEDDLAVVVGVDSIVQQIRAGLQVFANRWHYDRRAGIDYLENVFVKNPDLRVIRTIFWSFFMSIEGVAEVLDIELIVDSATRTLIVRYKLLTELGETADDAPALAFPE